MLFSDPVLRKQGEVMLRLAGDMSHVPLDYAANTRYLVLDRSVALATADSYYLWLSIRHCDVSTNTLPYHANCIFI